VVDFGGLKAILSRPWF